MEISSEFLRAFDENFYVSLKMVQLLHPLLTAPRKTHEEEAKIAFVALWLKRGDGGGGGLLVRLSQQKEHCPEIELQCWFLLVFVGF